MMPSDYASTYGAALDRLQRISDAQQAQMQAAQGGALPTPPAPMAPGAPAAPPGVGPAGTLPPAAAGAGPQGALPMAAPAAAEGAGPAGALPPGAGAPDAATQGALGLPKPGPAGGARPKVGLTDVLKAATGKHMDQAIKQMEAKGVNIEDQYSKLQQQGAVPPPDQEPKLSRREMGMRVMEFGLRMMAASAQGMDAAGAAGVAGLGLMQSIAADKETKQKEDTRVKERAQDIQLAQQEKAADRSEHAADRAERAQAAAEENATRLEAARIEAGSREKTAGAEHQPKVLTDEAGNMYTLGPDGAATPVTTKRTTTTRSGTRGRGRDVTITQNVPLKAAMKPTKDAAALQAEMQKRAGDLGKDIAFTSGLRSQGLSGTALQNAIKQQAIQDVIDMHKAAGEAINPSDFGAPSAGSNAIDFTALKD